MSVSARSESPAPTLRQAAGQLWRLVRLIRPYWRPLGQGLAMAVGLGLLGMVTPYATKLLVDEVYPTENVTLLHVLVAAVLALTLASTFLGVLRGFFGLYLNTRLGSATRLLFFNHLQHLPVRFFDRHQVGEVNSRFQDVGMALDAINRIFQTVFIQGVYLLLVPPMLFFLEWRLALLAILSLPLTFSVTLLSGPILRRAWKRSSEAYADLNAFQVETLSHIRTFKTLGLEPHVYGRARQRLEHAMEQQLRAGGLGQGFALVNGTLRTLNQALYTWFGWTLILEHRMSLGEFLAFSAYVMYLYNPLNQMVQLFSEFQQSAVHLGRMFEYLDEAPEQAPERVYELGSASAAPRTRLTGDLALRGVSFGYSPDSPVLRGVSLDFPPGSITALVGVSGSGKTSLLRLLAGLEHPDSGDVLFDGRRLEGASGQEPALPLWDLRAQLAVVWQEVSLIHGSLWENLTLGREDVSRQEADEVLRRCRLQEVLAQLPEGYESSIAEWGSTLSAGQRQRVALARALLRRAPILLLDEATANVDVETEREILAGLFERPRDRAPTVVFATHRLAGAALADRICVLEAGRIQGVGRHDELLASCPAYRRLAGPAEGTR